MKISVIGTGIYGLAIAKSLAKNKNNQIFMWTEDTDKYNEFRNTKKLASIIDCEIDSNITISTSYKDVLEDTKLIYMVTASKYVDIVSHNMKPFYKKSVPICIASKGIEDTTEELLSKKIKKNLNAKYIAVISGPTFAIDIINGEPIALALGSKGKKAKNLVLKTLANEKLKLRPTDDMIGIQLCGALKNIIAIASGILSGLGYSDSTRAFLINESLHDMKEIIYYMGGKRKTILSFAGIGDLMLTCSSTKSRNFSFGYIIGSTKDPKQINEYLAKTTVEGYYTLDTVYKLLIRKNIEIGLINVIYDIVHNKEDANTLATFLIEKK